MTSLLCPKCDQKFRGRGVLPKKLGRGVRHANLKPLPYFRPKYVIFPTLFQTEALEPGGCPERDKLLRHVHGSWRKWSYRQMTKK